MSKISNSERVKIIANALGELNDIVVFVGGAVAQFYSSDLGSSFLQTTYDVDCVVNITTYEEFNEFSQKLYQKHFINDQEDDAPICRFLFKGEKVDFMPKSDTLIGETNSWYPLGMKHRKLFDIGNGKSIFIMPVSFYLATKFEALHSRGGSDYRGAKDFEDIVYVIDSCPNIEEELLSVNDGGVLEFLKNEFSDLQARPNIREEIECSLIDIERESYVWDKIRKIIDALE